MKELFDGLIESDYFNLLKQRAWPYLKELKHYRFSLFNPLFWVSWLLLLLILSKRWGIRKSSSFCALVAVVLLGTTAIEKRMADILAQSKIFDVDVLRMVSLFVIALIVIYYLFIKDI